MTPAKKPAAKKPAAKPAAKKKPPARKKAPAKSAGKTGRKPRGKKPPPGKALEETGVPKGSRLDAAQRSLRDSLMVQRLAQGWTWEAIAGEAAISVQAARTAVAKKQGTAPLKISVDPVQVVERIFEQYQFSIGDYEAMASAAMGKGHIAVAVGAKRSADDARGRIIHLLQATGRLPKELGALRHLIDLRAIAVRMLDSMDSLQRETALAGKIEDPAARAAALEEVTAGAAHVFRELVGLDQPVIDGDAG